MKTDKYGPVRAALDILKSGGIDEELYQIRRQIENERMNRMIEKKLENYFNKKKPTKSEVKKDIEHFCDQVEIKGKRRRKLLIALAECKPIKEKELENLTGSDCIPSLVRETNNDLAKKGKSIRLRIRSMRKYGKPGYYSFFDMQ